MSSLPSREPTGPLDIYPYGRAAAREVLHDLRTQPRTPVRDVLVASAAHHHRGDPRLVHAVEADTAFLLAHAVDPSVEHALDGHLPAALDRFDRAPLQTRTAWVVAAQQAADPTPALSPVTSALTSPLDTAPVRSWLHDEGERHLLGAVVHTALALAEERYIGSGADPTRFAPASLPVPMALGPVADYVCRSLSSLGEQWAPFVQVQMAHALDRALALADKFPPGAGPLDVRIPASVARLLALEPITVADILAIARLDFEYSPLPTADPTPWRTGRIRRAANEHGAPPALERPDSARPHPHR